MTSDVSFGTTASDAAIQAQESLNQRQTLNSDFDDFLLLLTAQLQNQDPLDPTDSAEFTNQLVQFSQVEQQINTNDRLDALISQQLTTSVGQSVGFIGNDITYQSVELPWDGSNSVSASYVLPEGVFEASINIRDEQGELVFSSDISSASGLNEFVWDGTNDGGEPVDPGSYNFTIDALYSDGEPVTGIASIVTGRVTGVEIQNGLIFLLVGERAVQLGNVINAKAPSDPVNTSDNTDETDDVTDTSETTDGSSDSADSGSDDGGTA